MKKKDENVKASCRDYFEEDSTQKFIKLSWAPTRLDTDQHEIVD